MMISVQNTSDDDRVVSLISDISQVTKRQQAPNLLILLTTKLFQLQRHHRGDNTKFPTTVLSCSPNMT